MIVKKDSEAERKKYLEMVDTLGATDWQGFESFSKLRMSKSSVYNIKAAAAKYCDAQQMPEMSVCFVEKVKKTKAGYSYVLTMCWTNKGYFEIYKPLAIRMVKIIFMILQEIDILLVVN